MFPVVGLADLSDAGMAFNRARLLKEELRFTSLALSVLTGHWRVLKDSKSIVDCPLGRTAPGSLIAGHSFIAVFQESPLTHRIRGHSELRQ